MVINIFTKQLLFILIYLNLRVMQVTLPCNIVISDKNAKRFDHVYIRLFIYKHQYKYIAEYIIFAFSSNDPSLAL